MNRRPAYRSIPSSRSAPFRRRLLPLSICLACAGGAQLAGADDTPAGTEEARQAQPATTLQTVTVTSRRRVENSQDVPTAMSVLGGETLESQRIYRVQDLQQLVPSTNVAYVHARQSSVSIRGLGNNPASDGLEGSVGLYLDNVYLGRPGMASFDLLDIEQLEVLRGPQGTLFGKNTTAGVINIGTRAPSFTPERSVEISGGEDGYFQARGTISGPLGETLAGRLSAYRTRDDGYVKNLHDGNTLNGGARQGFRGQLLFAERRLQPALDRRLQRGRLRQWCPYPVQQRPHGERREPLRTARAAAGATLVDGHRRKVNFDSDQQVTVFQGGTSVEANWKLANDFTLTSISAYRWWDFTPRNDDGLDVPAAYNAGVSVRDKQWSQEIRLASPSGGFFDYVLGAYYFGQDLDNKSFTDYGPRADIWNGTPAGALSDVSTRGRGHIDTDSYALFAQGTWHLTERLDLTAGVRGTYEEKSAWVERYAPLGGAAVRAAAAAARNGRVGAYDSGDIGLHSVSPSALLSLSYRFSDQVLGYASLSHGEKSGGVNLTVASAPSAGADSLLIGTERANDAELGLKTTLLDNRLILNGNLFWTVVHGYQANAYDEANRTQYLTNAGDGLARPGVRSDGPADPRPDPEFQCVLQRRSLPVLQERPVRPEVAFQAGAPASCDLSGHQVVGASKYIANFNGEYRWKLDDGLEPYLTASYAFRSRAVGTIDDSAYGQIPSYALVNASAGLRGDYGDGQWDLSLWLKNAFDKTYFTSLWNSANGGYAGVLGTPRTLGVTARYDF